MKFNINEYVKTSLVGKTLVGGGNRGVAVSQKIIDVYFIIEEDNDVCIWLKLENGEEVYFWVKEDIELED